LTSTNQNLMLQNDILLKLVKHIIVQFFPLIQAIIHEKIIFERKKSYWT
jgi:hypothetical protein